MELFILSKFKKAGQLAFLIGLIFLLNSCGGGGGGSSPVEVTETTQAGFSYSSFSAWISAFNKFESDCESENANCTEQQARSLLESAISSLSIETEAIHVYYTSPGVGGIGFNPGESSYRYFIQGNSLFETWKFDSATFGSVAYPGFEVTSDFFSYPTFSYNFPGSLSGLLSLEHERIGVTDSSLNEKVFKGIHIRPLENSGIFWTGTQYNWAEIAEFDYGNTCDYSGDPRYCLRISLDNKVDISVTGTIFGFKTFSGDMPASGSFSYRSYAVSKGVYEKGDLDFLYSGNSIDAYNTSSCNVTNPSHKSCAWKTSVAVSAEQFISVNFSENTLTGSIGMQNFYYESSSGTMTLLDNASYAPHKSTLDNLSISATITGNSFSGTVSNSHFSGSIYGNFYGPSASEIGGVIVLNTLPNTSYYLSDAAFSVIVISGKK